MILVVDDEPVILETMKERLETEGFEVITAADGLDGLRRYQENMDQVEVVVTDLDMPTMNGSEMIRQIFKLTPAAKVIVASGQSASYARESQAGLSTSCLQKPYTGRELAKAVRLLL